MRQIRRNAALLGVVLLVTLACRLGQAQARTYENEALAFTIPSGWQKMEEVWDRPAQPEKDFYRLGVQELVMIQYPPEQGEGQVFFAVASSPLAQGEDLETRFTQAYAGAVPEIEDAVSQPFALDGLAGFEITYRRPWGEPWWQFRDIWLEKDAVIYVLSFHASPNSFDTYTDTFEQILESVQFKQ